MLSKINTAILVAAFHLSACHTTGEGDKTILPQPPASKQLSSEPTNAATAPLELNFKTKDDGSFALGMVYTYPHEGGQCSWLFTYTSTLTNQDLEKIQGVVEWRIEDIDNGIIRKDRTVMDKAGLLVNQLRLPTTGSSCEIVEPVAMNLKNAQIVFSQRGSEGTRRDIYKISLKDVCEQHARYVKNLENAAQPCG